MKTASVVICTHRSERYNDFVEAINSLKDQSYREKEIVVVVDGNKWLYDKISKSGIEVDKTEVRVILNEENMGLAASRNKGIKEAKGDIIAFFDDDAVADEKWLEEIIEMYKEGVIAVGGKLLPKWIGEKPNFLPEEFFWLVGATHKGFADKGITEVRNTFGSNISFKAGVLEELGGFRSEMGVKGKGQLQGEETELCERMNGKLGRGVIFNPDAIVHHKVFPERLKLRFLLRRAFWQGYSKRVMKEQGYSIKEEGIFIKNLFGGVVERVKAVSVVAYVQLVFLFVLTATVGVGYVFKAVGSHFKFFESP